MSKPETKSRAGEDVSPAKELKSAMAGFMNDFKDFSDGIHAKFQKQDERMNKLDRKTMTGRTPRAGRCRKHRSPPPEGLCRLSALG